MENIEDFFESSSSEEASFSYYLSSSSSSDSSDEEIFRYRTSITNYLDVVGNYTDLEFKSHFRLKRSSVEHLIKKYVEFCSKDNIGGRQEIGPTCEIYIFLWYIANTETYRQISDRFNITKSSVFRVLHRVSDWIVTISHNYIKWPTGNEINTNKIKFYSLKKFPRVVGAIDGSHIRIKCPTENKESYYNRKKYYSILLQGIVDADKKFIDIHCGEPGSMHDSRMFRRSYIYQKLNVNTNLLLEGGFLLGDSAYPDSNFLVTPFKDYGNLNAKKIKFNYLLSATRITVENAFGLLKGRFRRLHFFESPSLSFITNCIVAACVLHNICILSNGEDYEADADEINQNFSHDQEQRSVGNSNDSLKNAIFDELDRNNLLN